MCATRSTSEPQSTNRDFFDINGDGLPDIVDTTGSGSGGQWEGSWHVYLNRGARTSSKPQACGQPRSA